MDEKYLDKNAMEVRVDENDIIVGITLIIQDLPDEEPVRMEASGTFLSEGDLIELVRVRD
jgi:hypothetical protein